MLSSPFFNDFQKRFALSQAKTACRLKTEHATYRTTLGQAHYRLGEYAEALKELSKAEQIDKTNPVTLAFLSLTHHRLEKKEEAGATFRRFQELMKDPKWSKDEEDRALLAEAVMRMK